MNLASLIPSQYAKFITSAVGLLVVYLQAYGAVWHLVPAVLGMASALGVMGVPNTSKPAAASPQPAQPQQASNVHLQPPAPPPFGGLPPRT